MFKLLLTSIQIIILIFICTLIINYSFIVSFEISDYIFSISSIYFFVLLIFIFIFIFIFQNLYFKTKFSIQKFKAQKKIKEKEKGYDSFVVGMVALANKDFKAAIKESKKINNNSNQNSSLFLLLQSETFKLEKKYDELEKTYELMTKDKYTKNLGLRGMMEQYLRAQDYHHAFIYAEKLFNSNPNIEKIYDTILNIIVKTKNWHQLILITEKAFARKIIDKKKYQENKSIAFFEIAEVKKSSQPIESLNYIKKSLKVRENFSPFVKLYLELLINNDELNSAKKYLKKTWKNSPNLEYKNILINLSQKLKISLLDLTKYIIDGQIKNEESRMLIVEAAIFNKEWEYARKELRQILGTQPKEDICLLMARIEEGEGDIQKMNSWLFRSKSGKKNKSWICSVSKISQKSWSPVSKGGYFNSLQWADPYLLNETNIADNRLITYEN